jgi:uncharacterized repeat protein (TIGR03803 family)
MKLMRLCMSASVVAGCVMAILAAQSAPAQTYKVLHTFTGGADGANPSAGLTRDAKGNLYGTTQAGGAFNVGTVFKLSNTGKETVLYSFAGGTDGSIPEGVVIQDAEGNLYGTTYAGGANGAGTVFKLSRTGKETVLYSFGGEDYSDGANPGAGVVEDAERNLYGTTTSGGFYGCDATPGCGIVFKLSPTGKETVLYRFRGVDYDDGDGPSGVIRDANGNLYGTTFTGGSGGCQRRETGCGTVFKVDRAGKETVLYRFTADGGSPSGGVIQDAKGNLYGTTGNCPDGSCGGTVFKLRNTGKETVLYGFPSRSDGVDPIAGVIEDAEGNLYGTTAGGGDASCGYGGSGCGVVFKLSKTDKETLLYSFTGGADGAVPYAGLTRDTKGNLYGTTYSGGDLSCADGQGCGVVFELTP